MPKFLADILDADRVIDDSSAHKFVTAAEISKLAGIEVGANYIPLVIGTQTGTTASWTGVLPVDNLVHGQSIRYWLPQTSGSNVTLNLTLNSGTTGAINCYYGGTTRLTTHYPAGSFIMMIYLENALIGSTPYTGWWAKANYVDGIESYTVRFNGPGLIAGQEITQYKILMEAPDGRYHPIVVGNTTTANTKTINNQEFMLGGRIVAYWTSATVAMDGVTSTTSTYSMITMGTTASYNLNQIAGWIAHRDVYLKGSVNTNGYFLLAGSGTTGNDYMTQTLPTTDDGFVYIPIGTMYTTTTSLHFNTTTNARALEFKDGAIRPYIATHAQAISTITNLQTELDSKAAESYVIAMSIALG